MCAGNEDGIREPAEYQADARPTEQPRPAKKFKSRRVVHAAERLALPRSMSSVRYSLEAIFKSLTQKRRLVVQNHALSSSNRPDRTEILFKGALNR